MLAVELSTAPRLLVSCHHSSVMTTISSSFYYSLNVLHTSYYLNCNPFALTAVSLYHITQCLYKGKVTNAFGHINNKLEL